ncbi:Cardiolipin synthase C [Paraburkholderia ultramafica]|uniref:Cardiolipin synthase C n=1 Tax=Paraburkholderia ultramafica TaxID=1544867 RepID=A0A6S7BML0_9BURK|nr:phospholipase D family protein [Paraburkholderia ultramafica]CAB3804132.1 Cardiolipin synthase C [Paraburkholderia ultramafica]
MPGHHEQNQNALQRKRAFSTPRRQSPWGTTRYFFLLCCATAFLTACATRPPANGFDHPVTHALPVTEITPLHSALAPLAAAHPGQSGFRVLSSGTDALQMRIALARAATKTLDMQYYIANEDTTGKLLLGAALYAADHGVRVRMLVDDLNFKDIDRVMAGLNSHDNIEIRVFNPFGSAQEGMFERTTNLFTQIGNFTRRMHNKAMIADNQLAIVGGRNLADEYFSASETLQFRDLDVLAAGPITADISASFDDYWNSSIAYPLRVLNQQKFDPKELDQTRDDLRQHWRSNADPYNAKPLNATPLASQITSEQLGLVWAPAEFKADLPEKIEHPSPDYVSPPMQRLRELTRDARQDFLIISPYFVPHDAGVKAAGELTHRGVRIVVLTNSLAATDAVAVQAGYSPYRVPLLQQGVELYEFKPRQETPPAGIAGSGSRASLHAKTYVIDHKILVIGSMNLDPRSANLNTELALVIHSPQLADQIARIFAHATSPEQSYRVTLADEAQLAYLRSIGAPLSPLVWADVENGMRRTYIFDPQAGLYRNLLTGLFSLLPVNAEL